MAASNQMAMEMRNSFAAVRTIVDHKSIAIGESKLACDKGCFQKQAAEQRLVSRNRLSDAGNHPFGNQKDVRGCLRVHILKRQHFVILINNGRRNLPGNDFFEDRHRVN